MSPVIRVDEQVYAWLQSMARPFDDTPNSVRARYARFCLMRLQINGRR